MDFYYDWLLLIVRWLHITTAVTWIGTSIFFMWLDRTFKKTDDDQNPNSFGEVWMVHGGGFYHVKKLKMGSVEVPKSLHWFKWEAYWTWMSGFLLLSLIFYFTGGMFLLDSGVSSIQNFEAICLGLFSIFGSWFFYDYVWERKTILASPLIGHFLTIVWLVGMTYLLCHTFSGRAAYIHIGGMLGTWMTANVFMRIIPRQFKMVEAAKKNKTVDESWAVNAKNRSTHNTYFTLPVILIMLSNHFPSTYGHEYNWIILLILCISGAGIREYFVKRINNPGRSKFALFIGLTTLIYAIQYSKDQPIEKAVSSNVKRTVHNHETNNKKLSTVVSQKFDLALSGTVSFSGKVPENEELKLPKGCDTSGNPGKFNNQYLIKNGKIENVLVYIKEVSGTDLSFFEESKDKDFSEHFIDQKGCLYHPRVSAVRVGQKVTFLNSDNIFHNVKSVSNINKNFNLNMPGKNQRKSVSFNNPEITLSTKCSLHPWMGAYIAIFDHSYYSVTNSKGEFSLENLIPGKYQIIFWHEKLGEKTETIEIKNSESSPNLNIVFTKE
ncbi:urate hydroxylase PuuD [Bacteriovoracaceae bacterium]|nr:urate hydroxylase PuuD [Bacteriovoracaceae bacterium]